MNNPKIPDIVIEDAIKIKLPTSKLNGRLKEAQYDLAKAIAQDIQPYMPRVTGNFVQRTALANASHLTDGIVVIAPAPYGRYLYEGKVMVDAETGKGARPIKLKTGEVIFRHRKGATLVPTDRPLTYTSGSAVPHWYERAKADNWDSWIDLIKEDLVGG